MGSSAASLYISTSLPVLPLLLPVAQASKQGSSLRMKKMKAGSQLRSRSAAGAGGFGRSLREQRAKVYIAMRCVVMLLRWHD